jgi:hypothetical protein
MASDVVPDGTGRTGEAGTDVPVDPSPDPEQPVEPLPDAPVDEIEEWTLDQLHRRASEVGLDGRWDMSRDQLVAALRDVGEVGAVG